MWRIYILDSNFEQALIDLNIDSDGTINHQITREDAEAATRLDVHSKEISSLEGIQGFINLDYLYCGYNTLDELDVSKNTKLTTLICHNNNLSELDVSKNVLLKSLNCQKNIISELDVTALANLNYLDCDRNTISNLDVSNNPVPAHLRCSNNQLNELNVENNPLLNLLDCIENDISELNLLSNPELEQLRCKSNEINELILTNNPKLFKLECTGNNLQELDLSNNVLISELICMFNEIEILDVSHLEDLTRLFCTWNKITDLDLRNNKLLYQLECNYNELLTLDLRSGTNGIINRFDASNNENLQCISVDDELVDHSTWKVDANVNFSNDCGYNTQIGEEVLVPLSQDIVTTIEYENVSQSGETTLTITEEGPDLPTGFAFGGDDNYFDIETTAAYEGPIEIARTSFGDMTFFQEDEIRLMHYETDHWEDITTNIDFDNKIIYGETYSLSPFVVVEFVNASTSSHL